MKKLIFIFCLLFAVPAYSLKIYNGLEDVRTNGIGCSKVKNFGLYSARVDEVAKFKKLYTKKALKMIRRVHLCTRIRIEKNDEWVRGTYDEKDGSLYVEVDSKFNDTRMSLHHEFSSLLIHYTPQAKKLEKIFKLLNKASYNRQYSKQAARGWITDKNQRKQGFLYPYSSTSFENDFNVMATYSITNYLKHYVRYASKRHEIIKIKALLVKDFYRSNGYLR